MPDSSYDKTVPTQLNRLAAEDPAGLPATTFWERAATTRWGRYLSRIERLGLLQAAALAGPPAEALEIGCEGGRWSKMLAGQGWRMTCIDVDPAMLAECQRKVPGATCLLSSPQAKTIPCAPAAMDLLLCVEVAPVIGSDWFLPEAGRVLRDHGILTGVCWNRTSLRGWGSRLKGRRAPPDDTVFYDRAFSRWKKDLRRAGFELVHEEGFCWGPFGRVSNSPLIPWFTKLERLLQLHRLTVFSPWVFFIARKIPNRRAA